ncbi:MAG: CHASE domain-containing protein [Pseudomonadota bacterium]
MRLTLSESAASMRIPGTLAFVAGICLTFWTCMMVVRVQDEQIRASFERDADKVARDTSVRLKAYFDSLLSLKGLLAVKPDVDRAQFAQFVGQLDLARRYPGFQAIQLVRRVGAADIERFTRAVRADTSVSAQGYPAFAVHPAAAGLDHYIIDYNEPMQGNQNAFGFDLAASPAHLRAVQLGRDSGAIVATERVNLVQDAANSAAFVARAPLYRQNLPLESVEQRRAAFVGLVAIVFRVNNLMHEVIDAPMLAQMRVRIHDAGNVSDGAAAPPDAKNLMFDSGALQARALPGLSALAQVDVAQRRWNVRFEALDGGRYNRPLTPVALIGAAGAVISALIAALISASGRGRLLARQLRATLEAQRALQDSAAVGIALFANDAIARCNRGLEEIMGCAAGTLAGQPVSVLAQGGRDAQGGAPFQVAPGKRRWQSELELVRKDGSTIWCLINGKAMGDEDLSHGGVWVIQDISDRKRTEAALVEAKNGLEHSLAELARQKANVDSAHGELSQALNTLKQAQVNLITSEKMAALGALVAGIAHELNTPIGNCLLTATALGDMATEFEKKYAEGGVRRSTLEAHLGEIRKACTIMASSLRRAADLISSFKQVAVDQTSDQRRRFDLCEVVRDTVATYAAQLRRANCEASLDLPHSLELDSYPGSVGQVLSNLINNALLHAFEGRAKSHIAIAVRAEGEQWAHMTFCDDGVGMEARTLTQVFDPFFTTKMGQGGSGLGMNIVYNIVTGMLGGTIEIASVPEIGTTVTMAIPTTAPQHEGDEGDLSMLLQ